MASFFYVSLSSLRLNFVCPLFCLLSAALFIPLPVCGQSHDNHHPQFALVPGHDHVTETISISAAIGSASTGSVLSLPPDPAHYGEREGTIDETIGEVKSMLISHDEQYIFLLDNKFNNVRILTAQGDFVTTFGKPGIGPGEIEAPISLLDKSSDTLIVVDRYTKLKYYGGSTDSYSYLSSTSINQYVYDACTIENNVYLWGPRTLSLNDNVIHAHDLRNGMETTSFGSIYQSDEPPVRLAVSKDGLVACSKHSDMLVGAYIYLPYVYGYTSDGDLRWVIQFTDFRSIDIEYERGGAVLHLPKETWYSINTLLNAPNDDKVIQISVNGPRSDSDERFSMPTFLIENLSGEIHFLGLYPKIEAISNNLLITSTKFPFPRIFIHNISWEQDTADL